MNEWIEHDGFSQPVRNGTIVDVRFVNGEECCGEEAQVWEWATSIEGNEYDIVAYRVVE